MYKEDFDLIMSRKLVFGELTAKNARKFADREALVFKDKRYTWKQLDERVNRLANALISLGVKKDEKVASLFFNCSEIVECYFGVAKASAVSVPVNFRLAPREIEYILNNSDCTVLILDQRFLPAIQQIRDGLPLVRHFIVLGEKITEGMLNYEPLLATHSPVRPEIVVENEDNALIMYTSGTTGKPKGAVLTHHNSLFNAVTIGSQISLKHTDINLCTAPLFHTAALCSTLFFAHAGGKTVIMENFDPRLVLENVAREKVTYLFLVPAMWIAVLQLPDLDQFECSNLRIAGTGAAIMPIEIKKKIMNQFPNVGIFDTFGQTEMSPCTTTLRPEFAESKQGSVGQALPMVEIRVVDDEMNDVPTGHVGEIVYRGPNTMKEYYKNPEATLETFKGGWFHSGDMVRIDEEGFVFIVDRKKDMIISGGENIYPAEVEAAIHINPKVLEAAVIGVPDEKWGESVKAVVVLKYGEAMTGDELIDFCTQHLARYKRPRSVDFIDALPRNPSGKVLKTELRKVYGNPITY
ncbi:MAG: long-chain-fatty-acid--CoA ligase [Bacillota bacterium]